MRSMALALFLVLAPMGARAALTPTVKVAGLEIGTDLISVKAEEGVVRVLVDLYPSQAARQKLGAQFKLKDLAKALLKGPVFKQQPKMGAFKLYLVEYSQRDDYGQPVYSSMKPLWQAEGKLSKGTISFSKVVASDPH